MALTKITSTNIQPGAIESSSLELSGAAAGTYGAAAKIPVLSVNAQGIVFAISEVDVAGVTNFTFDAPTEVLTISTADGGSFTADVTYFASKTYVDQAESDANSYTDTRESAITTAYQAYADQAELDAIATANAYTDQEVAALVSAAPTTLDTLNELAAALGDDPNFATTVSTNIGTKADKTTTITAGTGLTGGGNLSANRTISIDVTGVTAGTYGSSTAIPVFTVNAQGQITSVSNTSITVGDGTLTVNSGSGLTGSGTFTANQTTNGTITLSHADTSTQASVNNSGGTVIQDITLDGFGHITGLASADLTTQFLGINAKAADSDLLDGLNSTQFLRSDTNDTLTGNLTISSSSSNSLVIDNNVASGANIDIFTITSNSGGGLACGVQDPTQANPTWWLRTYSNESIAIGEAYNEYVRFDGQNQRVGINNTNPQYRLDVTGNPGAINIGSTVEPGLRLSNTGSSGLIWDIFSGGGGASAYNNWLTVYRRDSDPGSAHGLWVQHGYLRLSAQTQHASAPVGSITYSNTDGGQLYYKNDSGWTSFSAPLGSEANPANTMADVSSNGMYFFNNNGTVYQAYVRKNWHLSRDWMLVLKVHGRGDMPSGSPYWTNATLNNETDGNINGGSWAKYGSWNNFTFNYVLMDMNGTVPAIMYFNTARTMYNAMQNNAGAAFGGLACNSTTPSFGQVRYDNSGFYYSGGPYSTQTGSEPVVQMYGINSFANNSSNGNPDNAGLASAGRAGARVGCPLDEGGHSFNAASNSGSDSGFGFGYCAGNAARTGSCGYAEWSSSAVVEISPGRLWVS